MERNRMIKSVGVRPGWGVAFGVNWFSANFTIFDIGMHYHATPIEGEIVDEMEVCPFRAGVYMTLFGVGVQIGRFWKMKMLDDKED